MRLSRPLAFALLFALAGAAAAAPAPLPSFASEHVLVVDDASGLPLIEKNSRDVASIASLTKLMTAMVVLDAAPNLDERIRITDEDLDRIKGTKRGVPVGAVVTRRQLLTLALLASDNRAAAALARSYPGGHGAFLRAVAAKTQALGLHRFSVVEPTGLSPRNQASAADMALVLKAASGYALIQEITSAARSTLVVGGRTAVVRNTNRFVGKRGWDVQVSKTGFTNEAGRCLAMLLSEAGRTVRIVLLGGYGADDRNRDVAAIQRWLKTSAPAGVRRG
jgi:serine-type D-Ala-D-Ala endopeptidase (penicillin-binding protein 7)